MAHPLKILQVIGGKKSGKTTTMVDFIAVAKEANLKVVAFKRAHEAQFDTVGTDSSRLAEAGADAVGLQTETEFFWHEKSAQPLERRLEKLVSLDTDLVLVEGFRSEKYPKIWLLGGQFQDWPVDPRDWYFEDKTSRIPVATIFSERLDEELLDFTTAEKRKDWLRQWLTK